MTARTLEQIDAEVAATISASDPLYRAFLDAANLVDPEQRAEVAVAGACRVLALAIEHAPNRPKTILQMLHSLAYISRACGHELVAEVTMDGPAPPVVAVH